MKEEYKEWIKEHEAIFTNSVNVTIEVRTQVYNIYNDTFNKNRKMSGCFRCWKAVRDELYKKYLEDNV